MRIWRANRQSSRCPTPSFAYRSNTTGCSRISDAGPDRCKFRIRWSNASGRRVGSRGSAFAHCERRWSMHGVVHVEIPAKDLKRATERYGKVFGWTFKDMEGEYLLWSPPGGGIGGGIYKAKALPAKSSVRAYLDVTDIDAKLAEIKAARGKIVAQNPKSPDTAGGPRSRTPKAAKCTSGSRHLGRRRAHARDRTRALVFRIPTYL